MKTTPLHYAGLIISILLLTILLGCQVAQLTPPPSTPFQVLTEATKSTNWLATFSIIGIGAGFFIFLDGKSLGWKLMAACFVVLSMVLMIARFGTWIAFLSMAGSIGVLAYIMYLKSKAIREIINTVEITKLHGWDKKTVQEVVQSPSTTKIVKQVQKKNGKENNAE